MSKFESIVGPFKFVDTSVSSLAYNFVKCSSLKRLEKHIGDGLFIISASRGEYDNGEKPDQRLGRAKAAGLKGVSKANFGRYRSLQADLMARHLGYITAIGKYWEKHKETGEKYQVEELSMIVPFKNTEAAKSSIVSFDEFEDIAMELSLKYEQDSYLVVQPEQEGDPAAELVYTGLYQNSRGARYKLGPKHVVSPLDDFLTILQRGNKKDRAPGGTAIQFSTPEEVAASLEGPPGDIAIRGPNGGWSGQILASQLEILFL